MRGLTERKADDKKKERKKKENERIGFILKNDQFHRLTKEND